MQVFLLTLRHDCFGSPSAYTPCIEKLIASAADIVSAESGLLGHTSSLSINSGDSARKISLASVASSATYGRSMRKGTVGIIGCWLTTQAPPQRVGCPRVTSQAPSSDARFCCRYLELSATTALSGRPPRALDHRSISAEPLAPHPGWRPRSPPNLDRSIHRCGRTHPAASVPRNRDWATGVLSPVIVILRCTLLRENSRWRPAY